MGSSIRNSLLKTSTSHLLAAQESLLKNFVDYPFTCSQVELPSGYVINCIDSRKANEPVVPGERTLILAHGLGSGLGFFFMNLEYLLRAGGKGGEYDRVIAFDWLGFGASSRPECRAPKHKWWSSVSGFSMCRSRFCSDDNNDIVNQLTDQHGLDDSAAAFFVDSFEEWREQKGIDKFTLVGHSLGGYLSARYAMKFPDRLEGLVLASPVGVPILTSEDLTEDTPRVDIPWSLKLIDVAWSANITPGQLFRAWSYITQNGAANVEAIVKRRFNDRWEDKETLLVSNYLYHLTVQPGSGEYAMNSLLVPKLSGTRGRMYARIPFTPHMHMFPKKVPILVLFGDNDWLAPHPEDAKIFLEFANKAGLNVTLATTPKAGHHLYMDNYEHFNRSINSLHK